MASQNLATSRSSMISSLRGLTNERLKNLLRGEGLAVSGNKVSLQDRLIACIDDYMNDGDIERFETLRRRILYLRNPGMPAPPSTPSPSQPSPFAQMTMHHASPTYGQSPSLASGQPSSQPRRISYKSSPFYHIVEAICGPVAVPDRPSNRDVIPAKVTLSSYHVEQMRNDPSLAVMLYCSVASSSVNYNAQHDIAFPDVEVRINGDEVKSNFKGLKNKPGTTKPADLTPYLRKSGGAVMPGYHNQLQFTYARTTKPYSFVVNLVKKTQADDLIAKVRSGRIIAKDAVIREMISRANDPDIVATSIIMSLKDPVSTTRMEIPCRSVVCSHNRCFDGAYFILLQEQAPTWTCPICNKSISYEALAVDNYVKDILEKTSKSVEQVTIEPNGSWSEVKQRDESGPQSRAPYDNDSDDDLVEVSAPNINGSSIKRETPQATPGVAQPTPPMSANSREASSRPSGAGTKRSAVIDLTLSDDDDAPPRPAKRPQSQASSTVSRPVSTNTSPYPPPSQQTHRHAHGQQPTRPSLDTRTDLRQISNSPSFGQPSNPGSYQGHMPYRQPSYSNLLGAFDQPNGVRSATTPGAGQLPSWPHTNFASYSANPWRTSSNNGDYNSGGGGSGISNNNNNNSNTNNHHQQSWPS